MQVCRGLVAWSLDFYQCCIFSSTTIEFKIINKRNNLSVKQNYHHESIIDYSGHGTDICSILGPGIADARPWGKKAC
jgi:hypothetical protein